MSNTHAALVEALSFYADPKRYQGPNNRQEEPDKFSKDAGLNHYLLDVTRDGGCIARAALAQAEAAQPVAWIRHDWSGTGQRSLSFDGPPEPRPVRDEVVNPVWTPLYAAPSPAKRGPMTTREIEDHIDADEGDREAVEALVREVEAWHGIAAAPQPAEAAQPVEPVWISVEDRLPAPDSGEVLVWLSGGMYALDEWHTHREDPIGMSTTHTLDMGCMWRTFDFEEVTHWMPLPAAPKP